eukprot:69973_1
MRMNDEEKRIYLSNPMMISNTLFHTITSGKQPDVVTVRRELLLYPAPTLIEFNMSRNTMYYVDCTKPIEQDVDLYQTPTSNTSIRQLRLTKLIKYLQSILFQFYSYQQILHKINHPGMILIELQENVKLQDIVQNGKPRQPMHLNKQLAMVTIAYLKNRKQIDFFFRCLNLSYKDFETTFAVFKTFRNLNTIYMPICVHIPAEKLQLKHCLKQPDSSKDMEIEAKLFEKNLHKSGLNTCQLLNINLYDKYVFALDVFGSLIIDSKLKSTLAKKKTNIVLIQNKIKKLCIICSTESNKTNKIKICSACQMVYYCGKRCQKISWKYQHRYQCKTLSKLAIVNNL